MKRYLIILLLVLFSRNTFAQNENAGKQVDGYIAQQMLEKHFTGLSLAVVKDDQIVKAAGYGFADVENKVPAKANTVYKIASVSKQFLAAGILLLQQDGKLKISDPLSRYIPDVPAGWKTMTLRNLLNHSAGLPLDIPAFDPYKPQTDSALTCSLYNVPLLFAPGDSLAYSNAGYFIIAEVIRRVSGIPWPEFISKRIFQPLQMSNTRVTSTTTLVFGRARGYNYRKGITTNAEDWIAVRPSGAFLSTVLDMAKWDAALYGGKILSEESKRQLWSPAELHMHGGIVRVPYGLGWGLRPFQGHKRVFHDGGLPGFSADFERFTDDRLMVIVLCNTEGVDVSKLALAVAGFYEHSLQTKKP